MIIFWLIYLLATFILSMKRNAYGCSSLIVSRILIPECVRLTPILDTSLNTGVILVVAITTFKNILKKSSNKNLNLRYVSFLLLFIVYYFITLPLADYTDYSYQLSRLIQFSITDILPVFIFLIGIKNEKDLRIVIKTLFYSCIIMCIWGVITVAIEQNPYVDFLKGLYNQQETTVTNLEENTRGYTTTSSTFMHPNGLGYFLPISFCFFYYLNRKAKCTKYFLLLILLSGMIVICSKRSALIAYFSFWVFYFYYSKGKVKIHLIKLGLLCCLISIIAIYLIPQLSSVKGMLESSLFFWNDSIADKNDISGSSFEMRIFQVLYSFIEIKNNILFGHGFGWSSHYLSENKFHPILYGFETILSDATVNGGLIGLFLWSLLFYKSYKLSVKYCLLKRERVYSKLFTIVQVTIALATGLSYFIFYGIYIVLLYKIHLLNYNHENINSNRNV